MDQKNADLSSSNTSSTNLVSNNQHNKFFIAAFFTLILITFFMFILDLKTINEKTIPSNNLVDNVMKLKKVTYYSKALKQNVEVTLPKYVTFPDDTKLFNDYANGVIVQKNDASHFILESDDTTLSISITDQTIFTKLSPGSNDYPETRYGSINLKGNYSSSINKFDYLTVFFNLVIPNSSGLANWEKDKNGYYMAQKVLLY